MSEELIRKLFPNVPSPEHTKKLSLKSYALKYIEMHGSKNDAIIALENKCRICVIDGCHCDYPKIIEIIKTLK